MFSKIFCTDKRSFFCQQPGTLVERTNFRKFIHYWKICNLANSSQNYRKIYNLAYTYRAGDDQIQARLFPSSTVEQEAVKSIECYSQNIDIDSCEIYFLTGTKKYFLSLFISPLN